MIKRSNTPGGAYLLRRAARLAELISKKYGRQTEMLDGYLIEGRRAGKLRYATVLDLPQYVLCPNFLRVPLTAGFAAVQNVVVPAGYRDVWQADRVIDPLDQKLPSVDLAAWRASLARGFAFGGALESPLAITQFGAVLQHPEGVGLSDQRVGTAAYPVAVGFKNDSVNQPHHVLSRFIDGAGSTAGITVEEGGGVLVRSGNLEFNTDTVEQFNSAWVGIPRALNSFSYASPPSWANGSAVWGRGYWLGRKTLDGVSSTHYLALARAFQNKVNDGSDRPTLEPGALWFGIARVDVARNPTSGEIEHDGQLSAQQIMQTPRPSYPFSVDACVVPSGLHALVHSRVVRPESIGTNYGENTYSLIDVEYSDGAASYSVTSLESDGDFRSGRHFYGGASPDGIASYFLYPDFNEVAPESPVGQMAVVRYDGSLTRSIVATPAQYQRPGMGIMAGTGLVCHIGLGLLGFLVTLVPPVGGLYTSPFDVTFCVYDPASGVVQTRGQITLATVANNTGYPCTAGGIGAVTVVQRAFQVEGQPPSSAVLLWTTNGGSNPPGGGPNNQGSSFISYDSGIEWHQISDTVGDIRGAVLIGSPTRKAVQGSMWVNGG